MTRWPRLATFLESYSELFFMKGVLPGIVLLVLGLMNPAVLVSGLLTFASAYSLASLLGAQDVFWDSCYYTYNALLIGFSVGAYYHLDFLLVVVLITAGFFSFLVTRVMSYLFSIYFGLGILTLPFIFVSWCVYLMMGRMGTYQATVFADIAIFSPKIDLFFSSLASVVFLPYVLGGVCIAALILWRSRILFCLAVFGYTCGALLHMLYLGSFDSSFVHNYPINYSLVAMALGGVFVVPSVASIVLAGMGVMVCVLVSSALSSILVHYGLPVFVMPFVIVTLSFVYVLRLVGYRLRPVLYLSTPEETLDYFLTNKDRFSRDIVIQLPFLEPWEVWQGFEGEWTHKGEWRYAYDFVCQDALGSTFFDDRSRLDHYYCFSKPVLSPIYGQVTRIISNLPDNPVGSVDTMSNWGNLILIRHLDGYTVELSHFMQGSIAVAVGDFVTPGAFLGLCGNSGYSPQPHLHIQVQWSSNDVSASIPFCFSNYVDNSVYFSHGLPAVGARVCGVLASPYYDQLTTFLLGTTVGFDVFENNEKIDTVFFTINMAQDGTFCLSSPKATLYFGKKEGVFLMFRLEGRDPYLEMLYVGLSKLPLYFDPELVWTDVISSMTFLKGFQRLLAGFGSVFFPELFKTCVTYRFLSDTEIVGDVYNLFFKLRASTYVQLDPFVQFYRVRSGTVELRRICE